MGLVFFNFTGNSKICSNFDFYMREHLKYYKPKISKCFMTISLFVSLFIFSPSADNIQIQQEQSTQKELVVSESDNAPKRIFSYQMVLLNLVKKNRLTESAVYHKKTIACFKLITKVKFDNITKLFSSYCVIYPIIPQKLLPQNPSGELIDC